MIIITPIVVSWMLLSILSETGFVDVLFFRLSKYKTLQKMVGYATCWKCATFWTSLLIGSGFINASLSAFIAFVVESIIEKIQE